MLLLQTKSPLRGVKQQYLKLIIYSLALQRCFFNSMCSMCRMSSSDCCHSLYVKYFIMGTFIQTIFKHSGKVEQSCLLLLIQFMVVGCQRWKYMLEYFAALLTWIWVIVKAVLSHNCTLKSIMNHQCSICLCSCNLISEKGLVSADMFCYLYFASCGKIERKYHFENWILGMWTLVLLSLPFAHESSVAP